MNDINVTTGFRGFTAQAVAAWKTALQSRLFRIELLIMPELFFIYAAITRHLSHYVETRKGDHLQDKLLTFFPRLDFSVSVFLLLYTSLLLFIIANLHKPKILLRLIEMHFLVAIVRQVCILLVALDPPSGMIVLKDIFLENTFYPHAPLTKDLFFSGHVASIWIYFLCAQNKYLKAYFGFATLLMSFMILSMHVHYTYDVYGAIIFTTIIYFAPTWLKWGFTSGKKLSVSK
jgi:hypothetical protein